MARPGGLAGWHAGTRLRQIADDVYLGPATVVYSTSPLTLRARRPVGAAVVPAAVAVSGYGVVATRLPTSRSVVVVVQAADDLDHTLAGLALGLEGASRRAGPDGPEPPRIVVSGARAHGVFAIEPEEGADAVVVTVGSDERWQLAGVIGSAGDAAELAAEITERGLDGVLAADTLSPARCERASLERGGGGVMADPPPRGQVRLYPSIRPALGAGAYAVELEQTIPAGGPIDSVTRHLEVSGPRFLLPATELHSVFPPPNSEGDYSLRLPQIAFKRRTLPWERESNGQPVDRRPSWLALVVLAEGEGTFLANVAIADALPAEVRAALGVTETGTCDVLEVTRTVVDRVFPREDELPLLCHVRETNLQDTEFAGSDDDGFVSVVISNRLPQPGHQYGAYLVSLEGRFAELPDPRPAQDSIGPAVVYPFAEQAGLLEAVSFESSGSTSTDLASTARPDWPSAGRTPGLRRGRWLDAIEAARDDDTAVGDVPRAHVGTGFTAHDVDLARLEAVMGVDVVQLLRFPVLAHWNFTCTGEGDFQALMEGLDVGLLGTLPRPAAEEPPAPDAPDVAPTGHIVLAHQTRRGEAARAWYRGPLTPRELRRQDPAAPPYYTADQARRIGEDGREDLSEAAAFELGRLLALSDPRFVAELQAWRRSGYYLRRTESVLDSVPGLRDLVAEPFELARSIGLEIVERVSLDGAAPLGPRVRPDDVGPLLGRDDADVIATGLGLEREYVAEVLSPALTRTGLDPEPFRSSLATDLDELASRPEHLAGLRGALDASVARITRDARLEGRVPTGLEHLLLADPEREEPEP